VRGISTYRQPRRVRKRREEAPTIRFTVPNFNFNISLSRSRKNTMMLDILLLALLAFTSPTTALFPIAPTQQQPFIPKANQPNNINNPLTYNFRPAIESDLPAITTIAVEAFSPSAAWHYLIPDIKHHKQDVWNCLHDQIVQGWKDFDDSNNTFLNVITVPSSSGTKDDDNDNDNNDDNENQVKIQQEPPVSFAVWNIRTTSSSSSSSSSSTSSFSLDSILQTCLTPPGTNLTRAHDFDRQLQPTLQKFFSPSLPESVWQDQLYLNLLATHPEWDGNGFGARQVRWGLELSRRLGGRGGGGGEEGNVDDEEKGIGEAKLTGSIPVTLLATPAGWSLYESLGFEGVENATIGMFDGLGELWFEVCKWDG
jgi:hypothetical protein